MISNFRKYDFAYNLKKGEKREGTPNAAVNSNQQNLVHVQNTEGFFLCKSTTCFNNLYFALVKKKK